MRIIIQHVFKYLLITTLLSQDASAFVHSKGKPFVRVRSSASKRRGSEVHMSSIATSDIVIPGRPTWQQTMLRIGDPEKSIAFYRDVMGTRVLIDDSR